MAVGFSATQAAAILNAYFNQTNLTAPTALWMKLHTGDPGSAGTSNASSETTRKDVTNSFSAASGGTVTNDVAITWTSVAASEDHSHYSIWSASTAGTFYWSGVITANAVTAGDTFTIPVSGVSGSMSTAA